MKGTLTDSQRAALDDLRVLIRCLPASLDAQVVPELNSRFDALWWQLTGETPQQS